MKMVTPRDDMEGRTMRTSIPFSILRRAFPHVVVCALLLPGCGRLDSKRVEDLEARLAASLQENDRLRQQLETDRRRLEQLIAANQALAPKVAQLEREVEAARQSLSRIAAMSPDGMNERMRAEVRRMVQEVGEQFQEDRLAEQRAWMQDLRSRHMDELVASAHLSPAQKEKLKAYEEEEQQAIKTAYLQSRMGKPQAEPITRVRERIRQEKETKIRALLSPEQYALYVEWKRQEGDIFRSGLNRRQQSPNANQKDM